MSHAKSLSERRALRRVHLHARMLAAEALCERHEETFYRITADAVTGMMLYAGFTAPEIAELWRQAERYEQSKQAKQNRR